ncbi:MAG: aldehyde ferredoxin oxidoreductase C-terminal domain-containing protein [Bacteroidales bacterium]|nr:aldehyde ferredoxin oxidoreductase C-terminal domain-containing protein [Bacteroidales bacterium]
MLNEQKLIKKYNYQLGKIERGYNNRLLYVNLSDNNIKEKPFTNEVKEKFIGGKGLGLRLLWDATKPETKWDDPENEIIISPGPVCGITQYAGSGKSIVVTISPLTDVVIDSNVGGYFGPFMKFSGFDALEIQGKAKSDVIIYIDGRTGSVEIFEDDELPLDSHHLAEILTEKFADNEKDMINVSVVSAGQAADHSFIGMLNFSFWDPRRKLARLKQAGRGGIGRIFRDKKIKAIVVKTPQVRGNMNNVVDLAAIIEKGKKFTQEIRQFDDEQCEMRTKGTAHLTNVMNDYDLLPTHNFKFGSHKDAYKFHSEIWKKRFTQGMPDGCWIGCTMACAKVVDGFKIRTGPYKGETVSVEGPEYETAAGVGSCCGIFEPDDILELNFYCDTYGIDTISWGNITAFLMECYQNGIINEKITGGLKLEWGNADAALEMMHQLARGEGFGLVAGLGVRRIKQYLVENYGADAKFLNDIGMENKGLEYSLYISKESLAQQGGYAMTNKGPQHDEAWLIFMDMVNNLIPTFENKAEALHYFPIFRTWFGLMGLCKLPWNDVEPEGNAQTAEPAKVPEHVENYVTIYNAVTGSNIDKKELILQSERVYNFQRVFNIRRGYGLRKHDAQPYRAAGPVTVEEYESRQERYDKQLKEILGIDPEGKTIVEKVAILRKHREAQYEKLLDAVYKRRGWTSNGIPTVEHLKSIKMDLPELIEVVNKHLQN